MALALVNPHARGAHILWLTGAKVPIIKPRLISLSLHVDDAVHVCCTTHVHAPKPYAHSHYQRCVSLVHNGVVAIKQPIATIELTDSLTRVSPLYLCARNVSIALCSIFVSFALELYIDQATYASQISTLAVEYIQSKTE